MKTKLYKSISALALLALASSAFAQTASTTPGVPTTGLGDIWTNLSILFFSGLFALASGLYFARREEMR